VEGPVNPSRGDQRTMYYAGFYYLRSHGALVDWESRVGNARTESAEGGILVKR
jgi:hypothetical protein